MDEFEVQKLIDNQDGQMATEYISREAAIKAIMEHTGMTPIAKLEAETMICRVPTTDVVEVVWCKDCIYKDTCEHLCSHDENWFCGDGKRKQDL